MECYSSSYVKMPSDLLKFWKVTAFCFSSDEASIDLFIGGGGMCVTGGIGSQKSGLILIESGICSQMVELELREFFASFVGKVWSIYFAHPVLAVLVEEGF